MAKNRKKAARIDLATEDILLAEEDLAAMRPALAVAPELVVQTLTQKHRLRPQKRAKKKVKKARKSSAKKARKSSARRKRSSAKKKKSKTARKK
jgi:O-acetyl-ADP-ribose deacetylase (regulator of RNase III)